MTQVQALNSTDFFTGNLSALREFQPNVAKLVECAEIPAGALRTTGRDGTETFRVLNESGQMQWMGSTSMPSISAAELFGNVRRDGGSVLLPGVLSGREPLLVAERLAPFAAVFVVERSPTLIRLAMNLYDYRNVLGSGRMVFLCGDDLTDAMVRFFENNPGYEYPADLFHAPHMTPAEGAVMRDAVERGGQAVLTQHARLVQHFQDTIAEEFANRASVPPAWDSPRVALLSIEANDASIKSVSRIINSLQTLGWFHKVCIPDAPRCCHAVARLDTISASSPDLVLFINSVPKRWRALLPRSLPVVSWYLPGFVAVGLTGEHVGPNDLFVASTARQARVIRDAGLACLQVEQSADTSVFALPSGESNAPRDDSTAAAQKVVVLADLPADGAKEMNLTLPSQVALWEAMGEETRKEIEREGTTNAKDVLANAEKRSGTTLSDAGLRTAFEEMIATVIEPAARARACVAALLAAGRTVAVYGHGWEREDLPEGTYRGPIPDGDSLCKVFLRAQTVVFPVESDVAIQSVLDALATGAHVVIGASDQPLSSTYPGLGDALAFVATYRVDGELVRKLPGTDAPRQAEAATLVASTHNTSDRLRQIVSRVQVTVESSNASVS